MATECSFDVVSKVNMDEVKNAITMSMKEIVQRYDFKGSVSDIELKDEAVLILKSDDEVKINSDMLTHPIGWRKVTRSFTIWTATSSPARLAWP